MPRWASPCRIARGGDRRPPARRRRQWWPARCLSRSFSATRLELGDLALDVREQRDSLLPRQKRGSESISCDFTELGEGKAEVGRGGLVFVGERRIAHQAIVG